MKRQRGRGRKPGGGGGGGGNHPNRTLESNGPDIKVRGSASHIYEKYVQLSRDASSAGDRVMSESYAQYAEHYFRMLRAMQPQTPVYEPQRFGHDLDYDQEEGAEEGETAEASGEEGEAQAEGGEHVHTRPVQHNRQERGFRGDRQDRQNRQPYRGEQREPREPREFEGGEQTAQQGEPREGGGEEAGAEGQGQDGFRGNRRRRGRNRYRGDGDRGPREGQAQEGPVEGFGDTVPAFVGND